MFNTGQIYVSENVLKIAEENEIMALLERHKKVNEYAINQGFGNIINIYNIKNERVYFHTVKQLEGITYTRIYCRGEY